MLTSRVPWPARPRVAGLYVGTRAGDTGSTGQPYGSQGVATGQSPKMQRIAAWEATAHHGRPYCPSTQGEETSRGRRHTCENADTGLLTHAAQSRASFPVMSGPPLLDETSRSSTWVVRVASLTGRSPAASSGHYRLIRVPAPPTMFSSSCRVHQLMSPGIECANAAYAFP